MQFVKVKVSFRPAPDRLYRVLLVPAGVGLVRLAQIIGESMHVEWEHLFEFRKGKLRYTLGLDEDDIWGSLSDEENLLMENCSIEALGQSARFVYDFGDNWEFNVKIYKRPEEREENHAWLVEGAGQGIWEDDICSLYAYLSGELDDEDGNPGEKACEPWDFENTSYSDFDNPLNMIAEQRHLNESLERELNLDMDDDDDEEDDDLDDEYDDEQEAIEEMFLQMTEDLDRMGFDKSLREWADKAMARLSLRHGRPLAAMLLLRLLGDEQARIGREAAQLAEEELPF